MEKGFCNVILSPLRENEAENSVMISQVLYGETFDVLENNGYFSKIKMDFDKTEAWMDSRHISPSVENQPKETITKNFSVYDLPEGRSLLSVGSEVENPPNNPKKEISRNSVEETASEFLNVPFLLGGRSFFGVDAAGFVQLVFKVHNVNLPRTAHLQSEHGEVLSFLEESEAGDLAFFEDSEGEITHVGIVLPNFRIIHVFDKVRIDELDSSGIFNKDLNRHTHKLRFIKRIF